MAHEERKSGRGNPTMTITIEIHLFCLFVFRGDCANSWEENERGGRGSRGVTGKKNWFFIDLFLWRCVCVCVCVDLIARIKVVVVFVDGHGRVVVEALGHQLQRQRVLLARGLFDLGPLVLEPDLDLILVQVQLARQVLAALLRQVAILLVAMNTSGDHNPNHPTSILTVDQSGNKKKKEPRYWAKESSRVSTIERLNKKIREIIASTRKDKMATQQKQDCEKSHWRKDDERDWRHLEQKKKNQLYRS